MEILNFANLSEKIKEELGVQISIEVIKGYMEINLDKDVYYSFLKKLYCDQFYNLYTN